LDANQVLSKSLPFATHATLVACVVALLNFIFFIFIQYIIEFSAKELRNIYETAVPITAQIHPAEKDCSFKNNNLWTHSNPA
jgi:quinol-cytochrome oxidoreductase complex cytochrome b subunit